MKTIKVVVKILLTVLFLVCLFDMPYGYFQLVRFVGMAGFILLAYSDHDLKNKTIMIIWICSAVLINPIIKIPLGRTIWNIVDVIWAGFLIFTFIKDLINNRTKNHS